MDIAATLVTAGVWPAVPLTGYLAVTRTVRLEGTSAVTAGSLITVAGFAVWSVPLLGSVALGVYRPVGIGLAGWLVVLLGTSAVWTRGAAHRLGVRESTAWDWVLIAGLVVAAVLYLGFPTESIYGGRDEGVYASHAVYMAHHGRLDVPYPWPADAAAIFANVWSGFPGFYNTPGRMTVQFGHLFPVWLAQAFATLGEHGLFRLNAVFALLALSVIYDVFELVAGAPFAVVATLFLAFNPSELWMARITLSEILTQWLTWSGVSLLLRALKRDSSVLARWAGVGMGMSAFVRFDSLFLLPMVLLAHAAYRVLVEPPTRSRSVWRAVYMTAIPLFALATGYFFIFSRPYLKQRSYMEGLTIATAAAGVLLLTARSAIIVRLRPWLRHEAVLAFAGAGLVSLAGYAYWIRPLPIRAPHLLYQWPGFYIDANKGNYRSDSLIDLAQYLSPVVVWAAIGGWYANLRQVVRDQSQAYNAVPLVMIAGFSFAYLYDHLNTPDHLWWIRRFTPVVVPGFVLYATVAARALLQRLPSQSFAPAAAVVATVLVAFTIYADRLILTFAEDQGLFNQLEQLARRLPEGVPIVTHGHKSWVTPLYVAFDRQVVPIDLDSADGQQVWRAWGAQRAAQHQPAYVLSETDESAQPLGPSDVTLSRSITEPAINRLPQKIITLRSRFTVVAVSKPESVVLPPPVSEHPLR